MISRTDAKNQILELMIEHGITPQSLIDEYIDLKYPYNNKKLVNVQQAMKELNVSRSTLYRLMNEGMPYYKKEDSKRGRFFDTKACKDYLRTKKRTKEKIKENKEEIELKKDVKPVNFVKHREI